MDARRMKWRCLPMLALLGLGVSPPLAAALRYRAFGDSITRGNNCYSVPENNSGRVNYIFDGDGAGCGGTCSGQTQADANACGYAWRLEASLLAAGIDAEVINDGSASERTPNGLTRIDSVLEASDHALLLMEGTNDVSKLIKGDPDAISLNAIKANLGAMMDKASALGLDSAVSTIIRRVCGPIFATNPNACPSPAAAWPNESNTRTLRDKVTDLAGEKNRALVCEPQPQGTCNTVYNRLCGNQTCVDEMYDRNEPKIGHLDEDGYDELTTLMTATVLQDATLGTPSGLSPTGAIGTQPTFEWSHEATASLYQFQLDDGGGTAVEAWHEAADLCSSGTCSLDLGTPLAEGPYSWRVRGRNLRSLSPWSAWADIEVWAGLPGAVATTLPSGDQCLTAEPVLQSFSWDETTSAAEYELEIEDAAGTVIGETYAAGTVCVGGGCSVARSLSFGTYSWRVQATNPLGDGPWSLPLEFSLSSSVLAAPTTLRPAGEIFDGTVHFPPTFLWSEASTATAYEVEVDGPPASLFDSSVCADGWCSAPIVPPDPVIGTHAWRVQAENSCTTGPWSSPTLAFEVLACDPVTLSLDAGDTGTQPSYAACFTLTAGSGFAVQSGETVTLHGGETVILANDLGVFGDLVVKTDG